MSPPPRQLASEFDIASARRALLRFQPASNWVSIAHEPTQRMTIGFGFDVGRPDASELIRQVGLDPGAVRTGRVPISDAQMIELFDLTLVAAVDFAERRVAGFASMPPEEQWALLELLVWLGPDGSEGVFNELQQHSPQLTGEPLEPSSWFDVVAEATSSRRASGPARSVPASAVRFQTMFESFGLVAELASDDPDLLDAALAMLPPGWRAVDGQPSVQFGLWTDGVITVDGARTDRARKRRASLLKLGAIVRHHLAIEAPGFTFVHAGVVDAGGCAVVIPGRSYTGKSTLVAELVRLGATYVSDEYAVLDPSGLVHPFAKPLSIRTGQHDRLGRLVPVPPALVADDPVRAGLVVLTSYAPGAQWRPSVRSRAEGAFALLQNTVSARLRPARALSATSRLASGAVFLAGQRGEAPETARALIEAALLQPGGSTTLLA
jgi:hypothetical protein